jgi:hypothetical protein
MILGVCSIVVDKNFLHVLSRDVLATIFGSIAGLQHTDDRRLQFVETYQPMESRAVQFLASHAWPFLFAN